MKQPHTEDAVEHSDGEQDTGNHKKQDAADAKGADRFGGTRAGSGNVEGAPARDNLQSGPDVERARSIDQGADNDVTGDDHAERAPERDERGRH
nr:hypothetical protein [uncultured Lichenicoccus sp.]